MIQTFAVPSLHGIIQMLAMSAFNREPMQVGHLFEVNPLTPKSDELLILPYNITLESNIKVTRIHDQGNDHLLKKLLIVKKILLVSTSGIVKRTVWRMCLLILRV